jgi:hypothetical protein
MPARRFQHVERADGVRFEVVEGAILRQVVRRLRGAVKDQVRLRCGDERVDRRPVADVDVVVLEPAGRAEQAPKKSRRRLQSTPATRQPRRSKKSTASEPTRPLLPVTTTVRIAKRVGRIVS